ncbi:MAG: Mu transposase C-terminal domain-containing protein [Nitrospinota bacterium]|nr:Mu transposase C-terminal domain-containing protein [Nitrospinota bacterium]
MKSKHPHPTSPVQGEEYRSARELAGLPGMPGTERHVRNMAASRGWESRRRVGKGGGLEYASKSLPAITRAALAKIRFFENENCITTPTQPSPIQGEDCAGRRQGEDYGDQQRGAAAEARRSALWAVFDRRPDKIKQIAKQRLGIILRAHELATGEMKKADAVKQAASEAGVSASAVWEWMKKIKTLDRRDWLPALAPEYSGGGRQAACDVEAWDFFYADYMRPEQPTAAGCYERLMYAAAENEWRVPSLATLLRRLRAEAGPAVITLERVGIEALEKMYPAQERDKTMLHAMETVNADGHRFDVFVKWPDGSIIRPTMVAWQDIYSGMMLSYRVGKTENVEQVRLSCGDMIDKYGMPSHAYLDNGRGFASKWMTGRMSNRFRFKIKPEEPEGILTAMGVEVHWTTPYHGQAKPIERTFLDLCDRVSKHPAFSGAYTGNKPTAKPSNYGSKAIPLEDFLRVLEQEIIRHNQRGGRRSKVCAGRSFQQAFTESYEKAPIRKATRDQRRLWLLAADGMLAARLDGAIRLHGNRYWTGDMVRLAGKRVTVRFDPDNLRSGIHVYTQKGEYLLHAPCILASGFMDTTAAKEHQRARRRFVNAHKEAAAAGKRMSAIEVAGRIPEAAQAPLPEARVVAPVFVPLKKAVPDVDMDYEAERERKTVARTEAIFKLLGGGRGGGNNFFTED